MTEIIKIHDVGLNRQLEGLSKWKVPESTREEIKRFILELGLGKVNKGRRLCDNAQLKYLNSLKVPLEFLNTPTDTISEKHIEDFEKALNTDSIRSHFKDKPYQYLTKVAIRKALKVFCRWKLGETRGRDLVGWLDTRGREKTPDYLKEEEIEKLYSSCRTAQQRFAIAVLFDSGARAEEFINIRLEDIQVPDGNDNFVRIALKEEYSKTKGRTVSLYWRHSLEAIKEYLDERYSNGIKPQEPVYNNTYGALRMFLKRLGLSSLKKSIHPHLFRHSSATYYAPKLNRQELCYRYGWRFSSNMPDVYISRAGMLGKELDQKFAQTEIGELKSELSKMHLEAKMKAERIIALEKKMDLIEKHFLTVAELERSGTNSRTVERVLRRRQLQ